MCLLAAPQAMRSWHQITFDATPFWENKVSPNLDSLPVGLLAHPPLQHAARHMPLSLSRVAGPK